MKVVRLVFTVTSLAALPGHAFCARPEYSAASVPASAKSVGDRHRSNDGDGGRLGPRRDYGPVPRTNRSTKGVTLPLPKARKQFPKSFRSLPSNGGMNVRAAQPTRPEFAADGGLVRSRRFDMLRPVRTGVARPFGPLLGSVRHRGPNPAVVGSRGWRSSNPGYIDGTRMKRKP